jgi:hypothetical protein
MKVRTVLLAFLVVLIFAASATGWMILFWLESDRPLKMKTVCPDSVTGALGTRQLVVNNEIGLLPSDFVSPKKTSVSAFVEGPSVRDLPALCTTGSLGST